MLSGDDLGDSRLTRSEIRTFGMERVVVVFTSLSASCLPRYRLPFAQV